MVVPIFIAFRIINFSILLWLFTHVFRAYFYKDFKINARKRLDWWLSLRNSIMHIRTKQKELDSAIASEQWQAERLLDNITRWQNHIQKDLQNKQSTAIYYANKAQERKATQEKNYQIHLELQVTVPAAFAQAQQEITSTYQAHPDKAAIFIEKTTECMQGESW